MAQLSLEGIVKRFGAEQVLHGIDLDIRDRELVVFVGPSGCGKSTLLRLIAGLDPITAGTFRLDGRVMNDVAPSRRGIAMVFQSYALYPHMDVFENMAFGARLMGLTEAEVRARIDEAAAMLKLEALLKRRPRELSGGQRQRVAIGRALVRKPRVLLLDEPLSNLDAALRSDVRLEIARLHREIGGTTIYVTHDQVEAMTLADRIVVMNAGRIAQVGTPRQLFETPADTFVATFIGSPRMTLLTLGGRGGRFGLDGAGEVALPGAPARPSLVVGARPDAFTLGPEGGEGFVATVDYSEYLGDDAFVYARLPDGTLVTVRIPPDATRAPGEAVRLIPRAEALHYFDPATGTRLSAA